MILKLYFKNFFKRFHTFFICLGIFLVGLLLAVLIFIGGAQLVFSLQPGNFVDTVMEYFMSFQIRDIYEILDLSILERVYQDIMNLAGDSSSGVAFGLFAVIAVAIFIIFGAFKGSIAIVGAINKKKVSNKQTKGGFKPLIVNLLIGLIFSVVVTVLMKMWTWSGVFLLALYLCVDSLELIFSLHYIYFSNIKISVMFKDKAVLKVMGLYIGSQAFFVIIAGLFAFITPIISFAFVIPFLAYNECNTTYTAITYFKEKIKSK